jgi:hypothetical protein
MIKKNKGIALIAAIMLIVFISIAVLGLSVFIVGWIKQIDADLISTKCLYLAQAGIHDAIYKVRFTYLNPATTYGSYTTGLTTVDTGETFRRGDTAVLSTAVDYLMVNTVTSTLSSATIRGARYQKATSSALPVVTIDRMIIEWAKTGTARYFRQIALNGSTVFTSAANNVSGYNADIANTTYSTTNFSTLTNSITFSGNMSGLTWLDVTYIMTDGSSKKVRLYPASNSCQFTIKSTGKVTGSNIYRTIKATYDLMPTTYATTSKIVDIDEINNEITSP